MATMSLVLMAQRTLLSILFYVCMCVCGGRYMYLCVCLCILVCLHGLCVRVYACVLVCVHELVCVHVLVYVCMWECLCASLCLHVLLCVFARTWPHVCVGLDGQCICRSMTSTSLLRLQRHASELHPANYCLVPLCKVPLVEMWSFLSLAHNKQQEKSFKRLWKQDFLLCGALSWNGSRVSSSPCRKQISVNVLMRGTKVAAGWGRAGGEPALSL